MQTKTEIVRVPGGIFERGSSLSPDEQPVKKIEVSAFLMDRAPVTNLEFAAFVEAGSYKDPSYWTPAGWEHVQALGTDGPNYWNDSEWNAGGVPVTGVSWWEALAYARFVGKTLPTEAQWGSMPAGARTGGPTPGEKSIPLSSMPTLRRAASPWSGRPPGPGYTPRTSPRSAA